MADRTLRWYIDGNISRTKTQVDGIHKLDKDYRPIRVNMNVRLTGKGTTPTEVDILDDGVSIFTYRPAVNNNDTDKTWTTLQGNTMRKDSIVRLDITSISNLDTCRDLTVELDLEEV
jgi:hypothetical protein